MHPAPVQLFCVACGAPAAPSPSRPVPICARCAVSGPQVEPGRVRWTARAADGRSMGPLSRDGVEDLVTRGVLDGDSWVAREGGEALPLVLHPDFRAGWIPGTDAWNRVHSASTRAAREQSSIRWRGVARTAAAFLLLCGSAAFGAWSVLSGALIVPQEWIDRAVTEVRERTASLETDVGAAVDDEVARQAVAAAAPLPAEEWLAELRAAKGPVEGGVALHLARGQQALSAGTLAGAARARADLEDAVLLSPEDPEAVAALATALAVLAGSDGALALPASELSQRAERLAPGAPSVLVARATAAWSAGNREQARQIAERCGTPVETALVAGAGVDLRCAVLAARLGGDAAALELLADAWPDHYGVGLARAEVALEGDLPGRAVALARELTRRFPAEVAGWSVLVRASARVGAWGAVEQGARRIEELDPGALEERRLAAEVALKVGREPARALAAFDSILANERFGAFGGQVPVLSDAAAAAVEAGDLPRGIELARRALALDSGHPGATLHLARALARTGQGAEAENALRAVDVARLGGTDGARFHVEAARILTELGSERPAAAELELAIEADPRWIGVPVQAARLRIATGNAVGAVEQIELIPLLDAFAEAGRTPLLPIWVPRSDTAALQEALRTALAGDARYDERIPELVAVLEWVDDPRAAEPALRAVLARDERAIGATAALAQIARERGEVGPALELATTVVQARGDAGLHEAIRGWAFASVGDGTRSDEAFRQAVQNLPDAAVVARWRGESLAALGRAEEARAAWEDALRLDPADLAARVAVEGAGTE